MNIISSWFCKIILKPIVDKLFIKEVKKGENIPKGNFILVSNHQSHLDWIVSAYPCVPRRFTYIGQIDKYSGLLGFGRNLLYFVAGVIPINRKDELSKKEAVEQAIKAVKGGYILIIYPEGTRSRTGEIHEGKLGAAKIFLRTGAPILPVGIKGTFELMPPGKGFPKIKKNVELNIGKPLYFKEEKERAKNLDCRSPQYQELLRIITERIMKEIAALKAEL